MSYENQMILCGKLNVDRVQKIKKLKNISEVEFKVFSQWGEDGIIQYLINKLPIKNKFFIEFGVEDYRESNTRFLMMNNNWSGFVIDGSQDNIDFIKKNNIYWKYDLIAKQKFITKDNINNIIKNTIGTQEVDLLSVDIDGNDYWVWQSIKEINPMIVICEYNSVFGNKAKITIPYREDFNRTKAHYSNLYFGASLPALRDLAEEKGYMLVGCTSAGNDAFFIRKDVSHYLKEEINDAKYIYSKARESRNKEGQLTFKRDLERIECIRDISVYDLASSKIVTIKKLIEEGMIIYE